MCARYIITKDGKLVARQFNATHRHPDSYDEMIVPRQRGPVIIRDGDQRVLSEKLFGLVPAWSKEGKVKYSTYNARLQSKDEKTGKETPIYAKPTWREAFSRRHCLVPMAQFIEPIYTGDLAGNMVKFLPKNGDLIAAAGIWENWISKETGEVVSSFSVLTDEPLPFIKKIGHDRSPVFLGPKDFDEWLDTDVKDPKWLVSFLRKNRADFSWATEIERPLAPGWEKRI